MCDVGSMFERRPMVKNYIFFVLSVVVSSSGLLYADCPTSCSDPCKSASCVQTGNYRMCATLCMDGKPISSKEIGAEVARTPLLFDEGVAVCVKEVNQDGVVVQIAVLSEACPMSKSHSDICEAVCDQDATCKDFCLKQVCWGQEVVVECNECKYSLLIVVEKSE